ncbi:MAG: aminotransferase class IV [Brevinematales bacterium]
MFPFFESIRLEKEGFHLLDYHQERVREVFARFYPDVKPFILRDILVPVPRVAGRTKCRVRYGERAYDICYESYVMRRIDRVKIVEAEINYPYKATDRKELEAVAGMLKEGEMIVFSRHGFITDSLFSNVIFFDGKKWITPTTYLLNGVKRRFCLDNGIIEQGTITVRDLLSFSRIGFINAMIDVGELVLPIENVEVIHGMENL